MSGNRGAAIIILRPAHAAASTVTGAIVGIGSKIRSSNCGISIITIIAIRNYIIASTGIPTTIGARVAITVLICVLITICAGGARIIDAMFIRITISILSARHAIIEPVIASHAAAVITGIGIELADRRIVASTGIVSATGVSEPHLVMAIAGCAADVAIIGSGSSYAASIGLDPNLSSWAILIIIIGPDISRA